MTENTTQPPVKRRSGKSPGEIPRMKIEIPKERDGSCSLHDKLVKFARDHRIKQHTANEFLLKYGLAAYMRDKKEGRIVE